LNSLSQIDLGFKGFESVMKFGFLRLVGVIGWWRLESECKFFKGKCFTTQTFKQLTMDERTFIQL